MSCAVRMTKNEVGPWRQSANRAESVKLAKLVVHEGMAFGASCTHTIFNSQRSSKSRASGLALQGHPSRLLPKSLETWSLRALSLMRPKGKDMSQLNEPSGAGVSQLWDVVPIIYQGVRPHLDYVAGFLVIANTLVMRLGFTADFHEPLRDAVVVQIADNVTSQGLETEMGVAKNQGPPHVKIA